jgi:oligopeptide transport system permease protein
MAEAALSDAFTPVEAPATRGFWSIVLRRLLGNRPALFGLIVIVVLGGMALLAPWVDHHDPNHQYQYLERNGQRVLDEGGHRIVDEGSKLAPPSRRFWLGTDALSRDNYSRLVHGARISLAVGLLSQIVALGVGLAVGMAAGMGGRWADALLMRLTDTTYAFPDLLMLLLLVSVFGSSMTLLVLAIGLLGWPTMARLVRGQVLSLREEEYVLAARSLGAGRLRIAWGHLLPNMLGPLIVTATFGVPAAIFAEATIAFLGLGLPPPAASWGQLALEAIAYINNAPYLAITSCGAVALTMMSFTFVGDGLRDALDPRLPAGRPLPDAETAPARPRKERRAA